MQIREIATVEFILFSSDHGLSVEQALEDNYVFVDWGLSFGLDHRRTFPDAPEAITRVSHAKMALDYISLIGGSAYLPRRMVNKDIEMGLLHEVDGAPTFTRQAYATFPVRSARLELIEKSLGLVRSDSRAGAGHEAPSWRPQKSIAPLRASESLRIPELSHLCSARPK